MPQRQDIKDKINTFHLVDQEILAAVPFENPLAKQKDVSLKELVQYPFIYYSEKAACVRNWIKCLTRLISNQRF